MLWLEADALIRGKTGGAKSLDDFCRLFYGPPSSAPAVVPYDFSDVVKALNTVLPYDWSGFWTERLNRVRAAAPLEGLAAAGWRLTYADAPSPEQSGEAELMKRTDLSHSLGFALKEEGAIITSVLPGTPADAAGIAPDSSLIAVDGRKYSKHVLADALRATRCGGCAVPTVGARFIHGRLLDHYRRGPEPLSCRSAETGTPPDGREPALAPVGGRRQAI
jgi:predicted metalloprotease with PDZ domain